MRSTTYTLLALAALCALSAIAGAEKCPRVEDCKCRPQEYKPATTQYDENGCLICKCEKCPGKKKALKAAESKWNCRRL